MLVANAVCVFSHEEAAHKGPHQPNLIFVDHLTASVMLINECTALHCDTEPKNKINLPLF